MRFHCKAFATSVAFLAFSGAAWAADPVIMEPPAAPPVVSVYDWTGPYIGIQGGYGWADLHADGDFGTFSFDLDGFFLGGYAGYNVQFDQFVLGIEGDINKSWIDGGVLDPQVGPINAEIDWFASLRGRVGYAWDRTLIFGTAGVAFAKLEVEFPNTPALNDSEHFTGWTIGAGLEHAFRENWLGRLEYRYYDFGDGSYAGGSDLRGDLDLTMHTISVGLAYKF